MFYWILKAMTVVDRSLQDSFGRYVIDQKYNNFTYLKTSNTFDVNINADTVTISQNAVNLITAILTFKVLDLAFDNNKQFIIPVGSSTLSVNGFESIEIRNLENRRILLTLNNLLPVMIEVKNNSTLVRQSNGSITFTDTVTYKSVTFSIDSLTNFTINRSTHNVGNAKYLGVNLNRYVNLSTNEIFLSYEDNDSLFIFNNDISRVNLSNLLESELIEIINELNQYYAIIGGKKVPITDNQVVILNNKIEINKEQQNYIIEGPNKIWPYNLNFIGGNALRITNGSNAINLPNQSTLFMNLSKISSSDNSFNDLLVRRHKSNDLLIPGYNVTLMSFFDKQREDTLDFRVNNSQLQINGNFIDPNTFVITNGNSAVAGVFIRNKYTKENISIVPELLVGINSTGRRFITYKGSTVFFDIKDSVVLYYDHLFQTIEIETNDGAVYPVRNGMVIDRLESAKSYLDGSIVINVSSYIGYTLANDHMVFFNKQIPNGLKIYKSNNPLNISFSNGFLHINSNKFLFQSNNEYLHVFDESRDLNKMLNDLGGDSTANIDTNTSINFMTRNDKDLFLYNSKGYVGFDNYFTFNTGFGSSAVINTAPYAKILLADSSFSVTNLSNVNTTYLLDNNSLYNLKFNFVSAADRININDKLYIMGNSLSASNFKFYDIKDDDLYLTLTDSNGLINGNYFIRFNKYLNDFYDNFMLIINDNTLGIGVGNANFLIDRNQVQHDVLFENGVFDKEPNIFNNSTFAIITYKNDDIIIRNSTFTNGITIKEYKKFGLIRINSDNISIDNVLNIVSDKSVIFPSLSHPLLDNRIPISLLEINSDTHSMLWGTRTTILYKLNSNLYTSKSLIINNNVLTFDSTSTNPLEFFPAGNYTITNGSNVLSVEFINPVFSVNSPFNYRVNGANAISSIPAVNLIECSNSRTIPKLLNWFSFTDTNYSNNFVNYKKLKFVRNSSAISYPVINDITSLSTSRINGTLATIFFFPKVTSTVNLSGINITQNTPVDFLAGYLDNSPVDGSNIYLKTSDSSQVLYIPENSNQITVNIDNNFLFNGISVLGGIIFRPGTFTRGSQRFLCQIPFILEKNALNGIIKYVENNEIVSTNLHNCFEVSSGQDLSTYSMNFVNFNEIVINNDTKYVSCPPVDVASELSIDISLSTKDSPVNVGIPGQYPSFFNNISNTNINFTSTLYFSYFSTFDSISNQIGNNIILDNIFGIYSQVEFPNVLRSGNQTITIANQQVSSSGQNASITIGTYPVYISSNNTSDANFFQTIPPNQIRSNVTGNISVNGNMIYFESTDKSIIYRLYGWTDNFYRQQMVNGTMQYFTLNNTLTNLVTSFGAINNGNNLSSLHLLHIIPSLSMTVNIDFKRLFINQNPGNFSILNTVQNNPMIILENLNNIVIFHNNAKNGINIPKNYNQNIMINQDRLITASSTYNLSDINGCTLITGTNNTDSSVIFSGKSIGINQDTVSFVDRSGNDLLIKDRNICVENFFTDNTINLSIRKDFIVINGVSKYNFDNNNETIFSRTPPTSQNFTGFTQWNNSSICGYRKSSTQYAFYTTFGEYPIIFNDINSISSIIINDITSLNSLSTFSMDINGERFSFRSNEFMKPESFHYYSQGSKTIDSITFNSDSNLFFYQNPSNTSEVAFFTNKIRQMPLITNWGSIFHNKINISGDFFILDGERYGITSLTNSLFLPSNRNAVQNINNNQILVFDDDSTWPGVFYFLRTTNDVLYNPINIPVQIGDLVIKNHTFRRNNAQNTLADYGLITINKERISTRGNLIFFQTPNNSNYVFFPSNTITNSNGNPVITNNLSPNAFSAITYADQITTYQEEGAIGRVNIYGILAGNLTGITFSRQGSLQQITLNRTTLNIRNNFSNLTTNFTNLNFGIIDRDANNSIFQTDGTNYFYFIDNTIFHDVDNRGILFRNFTNFTFRSNLNIEKIPISFNGTRIVLGNYTLPEITTTTYEFIGNENKEYTINNTKIRFFDNDSRVFGCLVGYDNSNSNMLIVALKKLVVPSKRLLSSFNQTTRTMNWTNISIPEEDAHAVINIAPALRQRIHSQNMFIELNFNDILLRNSNGNVEIQFRNSLGHNCNNVDFYNVFNNGGTLNFLNNRYELFARRGRHLVVQHSLSSIDTTKRIFEPIILFNYYQNSAPEDLSFMTSAYGSAGFNLNDITRTTSTSNLRITNTDGVFNCSLTNNNGTPIDLDGKVLFMEGAQLNFVSTARGIVLEPQDTFVKVFGFGRSGFSIISGSDFHAVNRLFRKIYNITISSNVLNDVVVSMSLSLSSENTSSRSINNFINTSSSVNQRINGIFLPFLFDENNIIDLEYNNQRYNILNRSNMSFFMNKTKDLSNMIELNYADYLLTAVNHSGMQRTMNSFRIFDSIVEPVHILDKNYQPANIGGTTTNTNNSIQMNDATIRRIIDLSVIIRNIEYLFPPQQLFSIAVYNPHTSGNMTSVTSETDILRSNFYNIFDNSRKWFYYFFPLSQSYNNINNFSWMEIYTNVNSSTNISASMTHPTRNLNTIFSGLSGVLLKYTITQGSTEHLALYINGNSRPIIFANFVNGGNNNNITSTDINSHYNATVINNHSTSGVSSMRINNILFNEWNNTRFSNALYCPGRILFGNNNVSSLLIDHNSPFVLYNIFSNPSLNTEVSTFRSSDNINFTIGNIHNIGYNGLFVSGSPVNVNIASIPFATITTSNMFNITSLPFLTITPSSRTFRMMGDSPRTFNTRIDPISNYQDSALTASRLNRITSDLQSSLAIGNISANSYSFIRLNAPGRFNNRQFLCFEEAAHFNPGTVSMGMPFGENFRFINLYLDLSDSSIFPTSITNEKIDNNDLWVGDSKNFLNINGNLNDEYYYFTGVNTLQMTTNFQLTTQPRQMVNFVSSSAANDIALIQSKSNNSAIQVVIDSPQKIVGNIALTMNDGTLSLRYINGTTVVNRSGTFASGSKIIGLMSATNIAEIPSIGIFLLSPTNYRLGLNNFLFAMGSLFFSGRISYNPVSFSFPNSSRFGDTFGINLRSTYHGQGWTDRNRNFSLFPFQAISSANIVNGDLVVIADNNGTPRLNVFKYSNTAFSDHAWYLVSQVFGRKS